MLYKKKLKECISGWPEFHKPFYKTTKLNTDRSGEKKYVFNSLGYRGEDYNPNAKKHIFVFGASNTFGNGLNWEETWPYLFKQSYSKYKKLPLDDINLLNFASPGHSNDYIVRSAVTQCNQVKPDLAIIDITFMVRTEYVNGNKVLNVNPHRIRVDEEEKIAHEDYYSYYTDELGFINMAKNVLLAQYFCASNNINYIITCAEKNILSDKKLLSNPICKQFSELIDFKYITKFHYKRVDVAVDNNHGGTKSNILFAKKIFKFYKKIIAD